MKNKLSAIEQANIKKAAKQVMPQGATVYTIVRHVSSSGMSRSISSYVIKKGEPIMVDYYIHHLLGYPYSKKDGVKVGGAGMDMGYHLVSSLSMALGYNNGTPDGKTNCYGLNHKWL